MVDDVVRSSGQSVASMSRDEQQNRARRLMVDFAAWLDEPPEPEADFYTRGLIVLDTNVLLDLYRVNPATRGQVIKALAAVGEPALGAAPGRN